MQPQEPNDEERLEALDQDYDTPFQPADPGPAPTGNTTDPIVQSGTSAQLPIDHPTTDTSIDAQQQYDEGRDGAAEASDTSGQSAVVDYNPEDKQS